MVFIGIFGACGPKDIAFIALCAIVKDFTIDTKNPVIWVGLQLWLHPLDAEFYTIATVLNRLLCVTLTIVVLPAVLRHPVVVAALMSQI